MIVTPAYLDCAPDGSSRSSRMSPLSSASLSAPSASNSSSVHLSVVGGGGPRSLLGPWSLLGGSAKRAGSFEARRLLLPTLGSTLVPVVDEGGPGGNEGGGGCPGTSGSKDWSSLLCNSSAPMFEASSRLRICSSENEEISCNVKVGNPDVPYGRVETFSLSPMSTPPLLPPPLPLPLPLPLGMGAVGGSS